MFDRPRRWRVLGFTLRMARAALRRLCSLQRLAPPRLGSAAISTMWNRWCTKRRFQQRGHCVLGCAEQEDSIEHYAKCPCVRGFARTFTRVPYAAHEGLAMFTLMHSSLDDPALLTKIAITVYAAWRVTERLRRREDLVAPEVAKDMLEQAACEGVRGHLAAARVLDGQ